jgi:hypothetical protein
MRISAHLLAAILVCDACVLEADQYSVERPGRGVSQGDDLAISFSGFASGDVLDAEAYWTQGCPQQYGNNFPAFNNYVNGYGIPVTIGFVNGNSTTPGGGCAVTITSSTNGSLTSADITLFASQRDGTSCVPYSDQLAHEFGHIFGLDDAGSTACAGRIMGSKIIDFNRRVETTDCQIADEMWLTTQESNPPPSDPWCNIYCWTQCVNNVCPPAPPGPTSPMLIALDRDDGFELTGPSDGVYFDIDASGRLERVAWTVRGEREAFLCLDRNGDGVINDGGELFGNFTRLSNGQRAPNGYVALAEYDRPEKGGNGNGYIDPGDAIWSRLRLWVDRNHDGISQPSELHPLEWAHLTRIGLEYIHSEQRDAHGNLFRFVGTAWYRGADGQEHRLVTTDVFLQVAP